MVGPADVVAKAVVLFVLPFVDALQQFASLEGVRLHDLEFFRRKPARFVEHRVGDGDLADIMHGGGTDHLVDGTVRKVVFRISERQGFQQKPGDFADPPDMRPGFAAPELNDGAQGIDNEFVETVKLQRLLFKGFHLLPDERLKMALVQVEFDGVVDAALDDIRIERLVDDVRNAEFVAL